MNLRKNKLSKNIINAKERITLTIDKKLLRWIDTRVAEKKFSNRSHALEYLASHVLSEGESFKIK